MNLSNKITFPPYDLVACILIFGASFGMTIVVFMFKSFPDKATAWAWLPDDRAITPAFFYFYVNILKALYAPIL